MNFLDPNQQLAQARGLMGQGQYGPYGPQGTQRSAYAEATELRAAQVSSGLVNFATGTAVGVPMVASIAAGMMRSSGKGILGTVARRADIGLSVMDPFGAAMEGVMNFSKKGLGGATMGLTGLAGGIAGGYLASTVFNKSVDFMRDRALEGQRNYLATRTLMREMTPMGFGDQSVLQTPTTSFTAPAQVSTMASAIRGVGSEYGMNSAQTRNVLGTLGGMGMINTSSVKSVSDSLRAQLKELKEISRQIGGDINEAVSTYQSLDRMGFRTHGQRSQVLRNITTTSGMTGLSMSQVGNVMGQTIDLGDTMGISRMRSADIAFRSMQTTAILQKGGGLNLQYMERMGGSPESVALRMAQIQLNTGNSAGGMAMMSNAFTPGGSVDTASLKRLMEGRKQSLNYGALRKFDPYQMSEMSDKMTEFSGAAIMARVNAIHGENQKDPLKARREQYKFLASMGMSDPQEQLQYLAHQRAAPRAQFVGALQELRNNAFTARDNTLTEGMEGASNSLRKAIDQVTESIGRTFERAGEAILRHWEKVNKNVSLALNGRERTYGTGVSDMASMDAVSRDVLHGRFDPSGNRYSGGRLLNLLESSRSLQQATAASTNVRGIDASTRADLLGSWSVSGGMYNIGRADRGLGRFISSSTDSILETILDAQGRRRPRGERIGALAEAFDVSPPTKGSIAVGNTLRGERAAVSPMEYMQLIGRDHGVELDMSNERGRGLEIMKLDYSAAEMLSKRQGAAFARNFQQNIVAPLNRQAYKDDWGRSAWGAGLAGAGIGAGMGGAIGAMYGGIGAVPGLIVGGIIGGSIGITAGALGFTGTRGVKEMGRDKWVGMGAGMALGTAVAPGVGTMVGGALGYFGGASAIRGLDRALIGAGGFLGMDLQGGMKGLIEQYSGSQGVDVPKALGAAQLETLAGERSELIKGGAFNPLSQQLFQKDYDELGSQERLLLDEMMRRHGGAAGGALAGERSSKITTPQMNAIIAQEMGRNSAESFFGTGSHATANRMRVLKDKAVGIDIGAAMEGLSGAERTRVQMGPGTHTQSAKVTGRLGLERVSDAYEGFRELREANTPLGPGEMVPKSLLPLVTTQQGDRQLLDFGKITAELDRMEATPDSDKAGIAAQREAWAGIFANAGLKAKGAASDLNPYVFSMGGSDATIQGQADLLGGLKGGVLSPGLYEGEGNLRIKEGHVMTATGVMGAMGAMSRLGAQNGGRGQITPSQIEGVLKASRDKKFFSNVNRDAELGALVEYNLAAKGFDLTDENYAREVGELEKRGVITPLQATRAKTVGAHGNMTPEAVTKTLNNASATVGLEVAEDIDTRIANQQALNQESARNMWVGAKDQAYRNKTQSLIRSRGGEFAAQITAASDVLSTDTVRTLKERVDKARAEGKNPLEVMQDPENAGLVRQLQVELGSSASAEDDTTKRAWIKTLSASMGSFTTLLSGGDDFNTLLEGRIHGVIKDGKIDRARLFNVMGDDGGALFDKRGGGGQLAALEELMAGGRKGTKGEDRTRALMASVAKSKDMGEQLGTFGMSTEGMSQDEISAEYSKLVSGMAKGSKGGDKMNDALEGALKRVVAAFTGTDTEKERTTNFQEALLSDIKELKDSTVKWNARHFDVVHVSDVPMSAE